MLSFGPRTSHTRRKSADRWTAIFSRKSGGYNRDCNGLLRYLTTVSFSERTHNQAVTSCGTKHVHIVRVEFAVDLSSSLRWGKPTVLCLWWITHVLQSKIHRARMQPCFVRVIYHTYVHQCSVWLHHINFTLGLLQTKHLTNGDQWKYGHVPTVGPSS